MTDFDEIKTDDVTVSDDVEVVVDADTVDEVIEGVAVDVKSNDDKIEVETVEVVSDGYNAPIDEAVVVEPTDAEEGKKKKKFKKDKKVKDKVATEVVEVDNIPTEVISTKDSKKSKKAVSVLCFTIIICSLIFSIVDWVVSSVTKDPQIVLHLMDWIVMLLYIFIAAKAVPFLSGKKKWVKVLFWICVVATLVCILVPMVLDYVELSNAIKKAQEQTEQAKNLIAMFA